MRYYTIELIPCTYVHIGTGEQFDPMSYLIDANGHFFRYDPEKVIKYMQVEDRKRFLSMLETEVSLNDVSKYLGSKVKKESVRYSADSTATFNELYRSRIRSHKVDNQLLIHECYKDPTDHTPIIPGSSIKGAIRTAILNEIVYKKSISYKSKGGDTEKSILGYTDVKFDPFRAIRVSDCRFPRTRLNIGTLVNMKPKRQPMIADMKITKECLPGVYTSILGEDKVKGTFSLQIDEDLLLMIIKKNERSDLIKCFSIKRILVACYNMYFSEVLDKDMRNFYDDVRVPDSISRIPNDMYEEFKDVSEIEAPIKIGNHSQVEAVTLHDTFKDSGVVNQRTRYGSTRWLFDDDERCSVPLGWCKLRLIGER